MPPSRAPYLLHLCEHGVGDIDRVAGAAAWAAMLSNGRLQELAEYVDKRYPLLHDASANQLEYGTAGFRTRGNALAPVAARVIVVAALRACSARGMGRTAGERSFRSVGFMVTASHNPATDNGFKIIDPDGEMLVVNWEHWCKEAANAGTGAELVGVVQRCMAEEGIAPEYYPSLEPELVLLGRDTRPSGIEIVNAATGVLRDVLGVSFRDFGVLTTPQLHFLVARSYGSASAAGEAPLDVYHASILRSYEELMTLVGTRREDASGRERRQCIVLDAANGVGALGLQRLVEYSRGRVDGCGDVLSRWLDIHFVNTDVDNAVALNDCCGADYAKSAGRPSAEMRSWHLQEDVGCPDDVHYYCFDGDADRLVAFLHRRAEDSWTLLDGDRISILYAMLLHELVGGEVMGQMDVGVVQTAYANGASTDFLRDGLHMTTYVAATGVKNLHPVARARDVGIYFEANGHGTVLLSDEALSKRLQLPSPVRSALLWMRDLFSQVCGDAIADALACEVALAVLDMSFERWADLYVDRPYSLVKVSVLHPRLISNTADETRALAPPGLQTMIDAEVSETVASCGVARAFVRPSGTEPVVRVYAEAASRDRTDALCARVVDAVAKFCN